MPDMLQGQSDPNTDSSQQQPPQETSTSGISGPATPPAVPGAADDSSVPPMPAPQQAGNPRAPQPGAPPNPQLVAAAAQAKHQSVLGKIASSLLGDNVSYQADPQTGKIVPIRTPAKPGDLFKHMLVGAILGGAAGSAPTYGPHGEVTSNPVSSAMRGAGAAMNYTQGQKQAQEDRGFKQAQTDLEGQQKQQQLNMEKDRLAQEEKLNNAHVAMLNTQQMALQKDSDIRSDKWHTELNQMNQTAMKDLQALGGKPAQIPLPDGTTVSGTMTMQQAMAAAQNAQKTGQNLLQPDPNTERVFFSLTDHSEMHYNGQHWVDNSGQAVDMDSRKTIQVVDIPKDELKQSHPYTVAQIRQYLPNYAPDMKSDTVVPMTGYQLMQFQAAGLKNQLQKAEIEDKLAAPAQRAMQIKLESQRLGLEFSRMSLDKNFKQAALLREDYSTSLKGLQDQAGILQSQLKQNEAKMKEIDENAFGMDDNEKNTRKKQLQDENEQLAKSLNTVGTQLKEGVADYKFRTGLDTMPVAKKEGQDMSLKDFAPLAQRNGADEAKVLAGKYGKWNVPDDVFNKVKAMEDKANAPKDMSSGLAPEQETGVLNVARDLVGKGQTRDQVQAALSQKLGSKASGVMNWLDSKNVFSQAHQQKRSGLLEKLGQALHTEQ